MANSPHGGAMTASQAYHVRARGEAYAALSLAFNQGAVLCHGRELSRLVSMCLDRYASVSGCRFLFTPLTGDLFTLSGEPGYEAQLNDDFNRLFYGPAALLAPPYESVYVSADGRVMGHAAFDVLDCYSRNGLSLRETFRDCPDHIAAELEFMAHLCAKEENAWNTGTIGEAATLRAAQKRFLDEHPIRWIPQFCCRVSSGAHSHFFQTVARILLNFVQCEAADPEGMEAVEVASQDRIPGVRDD